MDISFLSPHFFLGSFGFSFTHGNVYIAAVAFWFQNAICKTARIERGAETAM